MSITQKQNETPGADFILNLEVYEGPIDVLLALARDQKLDLAQISILKLADQYLEFIANARQVHLEMAADYLVMAAWLAYLKSRLLLPTPDEVKPTAEEMAEALTFQLRRLEAMQNAGATLIGRTMLNRDVFTRGQPEHFSITKNITWQADLYELLQVYGEVLARKEKSVLHIKPTNLFSIDEAIERLRKMLGSIPDWLDIRSLIPSAATPLQQRSAMASTLIAGLELAKNGLLQLKQDSTFGPIYFMDKR